MRVARWRWVLVPMIVVIAGCLPQPPASMPASFLQAFSGRDGNPTFMIQPTPDGSTGQDVATAIREEEPRFRGRAVPIYGVLDCHGDRRCTPGTMGDGSGAARTVWVVLFPDCTGRADPTDVGWAVVDAVEGIGNGYIGSSSCHTAP